MPSSASRRLLLAWLVLVASGATAADSPQEPPLDQGLEEAVEVRLAHRAVLLDRGHLAGRGACSKLTPEQIEVLEDGNEMQVVHLGPRPLARVHALMFDTSSSMHPRLAQAKLAALEYIDALPADEPAMLAGFDQLLMLAAAPTTDRQRLHVEIERMRAGRDTALWEALDDLIAYIGHRPGEKVVVLISDGEDTASRGQEAFRHVLDAARATENLVIFPIGINLSSGAWHETANVRAQLSMLAEATGGRLFEIERASKMPGVLKKIGERLAARSYLSYVPDPPGAGPGEWREVSLRTRRGSRCKVVSIGPPERYVAGRSVGRKAWTIQALAPTEETPVDVARCVTGQSEAQVVARLHLPQRAAGVGYAVDSVLSIQPANVLVAEVREPQFPDRGGPRSSSRSLLIDARPAAEVVATTRGPLDVLLRVFEWDRCSEFDGGADLPPFMVEGRTFLHTREILGRALATTRPDYKAWAGERIEAAVDSRIETLLRDVAREADAAPEMLSAVRDNLVEQDSAIDSGLHADYVAEWLGDLSPGVAARALEALAIEELMRSDLRSATPMSDRIEAAWPRMREWFAPRRRASAVTPLIPAYDDTSGRIGFYRFLVAGPFRGRSARATLPARPLAVTTARILRRGFETALLAEFEVRSVDYTRVNWDDTFPKRCLARDELGRRRPRPVQRVTLRFEHEDAALAIDAYFAVHASGSVMELRCIDPRSVQGTEALVERLLQFVSSD